MYRIKTLKSQITIAHDKVGQLMDIAKGMMSEANRKENGCRWDDGSYHYPAVNTNRVLAAKTIEELFAAWGYAMYNFAADNAFAFYRVNTIENREEGLEETFFAAIAPCLVSGSFIDCEGSDGEVWRWEWSDGKFYCLTVEDVQYTFDHPSQIVFEDRNNNLAEVLLEVEREQNRVLLDETKNLHHLIMVQENHIDILQKENEKLMKERDLARRCLCYMWAEGQPKNGKMTARDYAAENGWDCFDKDGE